MRGAHRRRGIVSRGGWLSLHRQRPPSFVVGLFASALVLGGIGVVLVSSVPSSTQTMPAAPLPGHPFSAHIASVRPPTTTPPAAVSTLAPMRVLIPSLGVTAPLVREPVFDHHLSIPPDVHHVGIFSGGARVSGSVGTVLLAGHVNWVGQGDGAFYPLSRAIKGTSVLVSPRVGKTTVWSVTEVEVLSQSALPQTVFSPSGPRRLVMVTCGGPYDSATHTYDDNVIVTAAPAPSTRTVS